MKILGLNNGQPQSSAVIVVDGKVVAGSQEERFNRQKRSRSFPTQSIEYCLLQENCNILDVDAVAQAWNPGAYWEKYNPMISAVRTRREDYFYSVPDNLFQLCDRTPPRHIEMRFGDQDSLPPVHFVQHHDTHSAFSFYTSPFEEAAILTCDWTGEFECTTFSMGKGIEIELLDLQRVPDSIGLFYATITELLGYQPSSDEWKVMALSAFDVPSEEIRIKLKETIEITSEGKFLLDQSYYKGELVRQPHLFTPKLVEHLGGRVGAPGEKADEWHIAVAIAMQAIAEEAAISMMTRLYEMTGCNNLVVGGGFFMNSVLNGKVLDQTPFQSFYVPYAPTDAGNSIGAALHVNHRIFKQPRSQSLANSAIGPEYSLDEIENALKRRKLPVNKVDDPAEQVADALHAGQVIGFFSGKSEFGDRALGHRSIIASPIFDGIKDRINASVKYRESYRPFAPSVLAEKASTYFDVKQNERFPFMEKVVQVKAEYLESLPGITHVDGSARLHTVEEQENTPFYDVIKAFEKRSGYPIVLNTSFNVNGEPMVLTPDDAISCFYSSGIDMLIMEKFILRK